MPGDGWQNVCPAQQKENIVLKGPVYPQAILQINNAAPRKPISAITQDFQTDPIINTPPKTIAEKHARKAITRGQGRAELPPEFRKTKVPSVFEPDADPASQSDKQPEQFNRKPKNQPPVLVRKPIKRKRNRVSGKILIFSMGLIALSVLSSYILFSTGLTTYTRVLDWVNTQIENNADSLPVIGEKPTPTPQSLYDQPAEEPNILATYFPTPAATPAPDNLPRQQYLYPKIIMPASQPKFQRSSCGGS